MVRFKLSLVFLGCFSLGIAVLSGGVPSRFHDFAQVGDGGGIRTIFLITNQNDSATEITLTFRTPSGTPLELTLEGASASQFDFVIPAGGSRTLQTAGESPTATVGWAQLRSQESVGAQALFEIRANDRLITQAAIEATGPSSRADFFVQQSETQRVGLALANLTQSTIQFRLVLKNQEGEMIGEPVTFSLDPLGQQAVFLDQLIDDLGPFQGICNLLSSGSFAAVSLQQTGLVLGTVPPLEIF